MVAAMTLPMLALAACGGGDEETAAGGGGSGACEASDGDVELTFVTWVPGMDQVVEMWNEENPDVQVTVETTPAGNAGTYSNLFNGLEAGTAPDLSQIEYDSLPSFRLQDGLQDISACEGISDASGDFVDWTWSQVQLGDEGVYAIPQDTGPMALFYREDLFTQAGITTPPPTRARTPPAAWRCSTARTCSPRPASPSRRPPGSSTTRPPSSSSRPPAPTSPTSRRATRTGSPGCCGSAARASSSSTATRCRSTSTAPRRGRWPTTGSA